LQVGGQPVAGGIITLENQGRDVTLSFPGGVPAGQYTFVLGTGITSLNGGLPLPAAVTYPVMVVGPKLWISDSDGPWGTGLNWNGGTIPATNDFVIIDRPGTSPTIHITGEQYCRSLVSSENLDFALSGGTLYLEDLAEIDGSLVVGTAATGRFSGGRSLLRGPLSVSSHFYLNSHMMELAPTATPHYFDGFSIEPGVGSRSSHLSPAELHTLAGSVLEIHATDPNALLVQIHGADLINGSAVPLDLRSTFRNEGELRKTGPGLASINAIQFENDGLVDVREGTLQVASALSALSFNGLCRIATPATLQVNGQLAGTVFAPAANFDGDGTLELKGATVQCDYRFAGLTRIVGASAFMGPVHSAGPWLITSTAPATFSGLNTEMTGPVTLVGGAVNFNSPTETVLPNLIVGIPPSAFSVSTVAGTGKVRLTGALMVTNKLSLGGAKSIQVTVAGPMDIRTNFTGVHLTIDGATIWHSGPINTDVGMTILPAGSFEMAATNPAQAWAHFGIANQGTLTKTSPGVTTLNDLGVFPPLLNSGLVVAGAGQLLLVDGTYQQTAGETRLAGGDIAFNNVGNSQFTFSGGRLTGAGVLGGKLQASGTAEISPGSPVGTLVVSNSVGAVTVSFIKVANQPGPQLTMDLAGPAPGTGYDQIQVVGSVNTTGATLNINLLNGYLPNIGDTFQIVSSTTLSGQFAQVNGAAIAPGKAFQVNYVTTGTNRGVVLQVVSAP
jgi:hypothetical protein